MSEKNKNAKKSNSLTTSPRTGTLSESHSKAATNGPFLLEETLIDNMTSFLEANGAVEMDKNALRNMAKSLTIRLNDTSPGTLHDVKMDNPYGVGYNSPCSGPQAHHGSISPAAAQGRSVREFEEQMANLRKENFNLKLRLYFIEESIPGYHQISSTSDGQETLMKQLIDSKVEMELLRKEISEKQTLLQDAARAISHIENLLKETESKHQVEVNDLKQKLEKLEIFEKKYELEKANNAKGLLERQEDIILERSTDVEKDLNVLQRVRELEELLRQSDEKLNDFQSQITKLDEILGKRDETIREYEDKVKELVFQNNELLENAEINEKEAASNERCLRGIRTANVQLKSENEKLTQAIQISQENFNKEINCLKACEKKMRDQQDSLTKLQVQQQHTNEIQKYKIELADKACMIMDLEEQLKNRNNLYDKACTTIQTLMLSIKSQKTEITQLKEHSANQSNNSKSIQQKEISNTGLSGLEFGTGQSRFHSDSEAQGDFNTSQKHKMEKVIEQQEVTIQNLKTDVKKKTADLQNLVNKELWEKNREIERLNKMLNNKSNTTTTTTTNNTTNESHRELGASFSEAEFAKAVQRNKLLQRKVDILMQRLDTERNSDTVIQQLRNDLKKTREDAEVAHKLRKECSEFSTILSTRLEELAGFLNSLLRHKDVLGFLAADKRKAMRKAVDRSLDLSKSFNMTLSVSGLSMIDQSLTELTNLSGLLDAFEAGMANETFNSHVDINASNLQSLECLKAENKALQRELEKRRIAEGKKERRSLPLSVMVENRESESEAWSEPDRKVSMARMGLEDHSGSLLLPKEQPILQKTESDSDCSASAQLDSRSTKSRTYERIAHLEQVLQQRDKRIAEIQHQLLEAESLTKVESSKVQELTEELADMRLRNKELRDDLEAIGTTDDAQSLKNESFFLPQIAEKNQLLERIQEEKERLLVETRLADMQINSLKSEMEEMKESYEIALTRAVKKQEEQSSLYEECKQQLSELQKQYIECQRSIECLQENEQELKQTLVESELTVRNMQKQIDESTLHASKSTTERLKALNEKLQVEKHLQEVTQQLSLYQTECNQLQMRIRILECEQKILSESLADAKEAAKTAKQSGYTSEEVPMTTTGKAFNSVAPLMLSEEQRIHNSSPDLGIESDAGRVSSAEISHLQTALLKTVEIKTDGEENANEADNLISSTEDVKPLTLNNSISSSTFPKHDCAKVDQEIADLRRKLLRTQRAFEDTYQKLRNSNLRKAQIEKDIKNQILKTHNVLRNVRSNMENENAPKSQHNQQQH